LIGSSWFDDNGRKDFSCEYTDVRTWEEAQTRMSGFCVFFFEAEAIKKWSNWNSFYIM